MAAEKGSGFLLRKGPLASEVTVAGLRTTSITFNGETVDVTNKDSSAIRELLAAAGVASVAISADGVFQDDTQITAMRTAVLAQTIDPYVLLYANTDTVSGNFQCTNMENAGDFNGELTYSVTLESSGTITITDN